jgi:hypothetical protein
LERRTEVKQNIVGYILGIFLGLLMAALHKNGCSLPGW